MTVSRVSVWGIVLAVTFFSWFSVALATAPTILVVGDSLSAAYGIPAEQGWVSLLQTRLRAEGYHYRVLNASISGDTTRGGLTRLPRALEQHRPQIVILELGGNDGLRGFGLERTREHLQAMIRLIRDAGAQPLLLGVKLPANYGSAFGQKFHQIYRDLSDEDGVPLVPFFLEGIAETPDLMQADGIHPAAGAQPRILDNIWAALQGLLSG